MLRRTRIRKMFSSGMVPSAGSPRSARLHVDPEWHGQGRGGEAGPVIAGLVADLERQLGGAGLGDKYIDLGGNSGYAVLGFP